MNGDVIDVCDGRGGSHDGTTALEMTACENAVRSVKVLKDLIWSGILIGSNRFVEYGGWRPIAAYELKWIRNRESHHIRCRALRIIKKKMS